jgi:hypothetical protein
MKKLLTLVVVALFTTAAIAQDSKVDKKSDAKVETKAAHECYAFKEGKLVHCWGADKSEVMTTNAKLKNGTTITPAGEMTMKDGTTAKLEEGQCVSLMGSVGDCEKMHAMAPEDKMQEDKK